MHIQQLVTMANEIAAFFHGAAADETEAADSVATHLKRFWHPRMRRQIVDHLEAGGEGLSPLARAGLERLTKQSA